MPQYWLHLRYLGGLAMLLRWPWRLASDLKYLPLCCFWNVMLPFLLYVIMSLSQDVILYHHKGFLILTGPSGGSTLHMQSRAMCKIFHCEQPWMMVIWGSIGWVHAHETYCPLRRVSWGALSPLWKIIQLNTKKWFVTEFIKSPILISSVTTNYGSYRSSEVPNCFLLCNWNKIKLERKSI